MSRVVTPVKRPGKLAEKLLARIILAGVLLAGILAMTVVKTKWTDKIKETVLTVIGYYTSSDDMGGIARNTGAAAAPTAESEEIEIIAEEIECFGERIDEDILWALYGDGR